MTDEAKAELAKIENKIGDYICQLCKEIYDDAFGLAQHRYIITFIHCEYTELYNIEVASFIILSLTWFDANANLYWYFYSHLKICH